MRDVLKFENIPQCIESAINDNLLFLVDLLTKIENGTLVLGESKVGGWFKTLSDDDISGLIELCDLVGESTALLNSQALVAETFAIVVWLSAMEKGNSVVDDDKVIAELFNSFLFMLTIENMRRKGLMDVEGVFSFDEEVTMKITDKGEERVKGMRGEKLK